MTHFEVYLKHSVPGHRNAWSITTSECMVLPGNPATLCNPFTFLILLGYFTFPPLQLLRPPSHPISAGDFASFFTDKIASDCISECLQTPTNIPTKCLVSELCSLSPPISVDYLCFPRPILSFGS